jgi:hypothetical protein
MVDEVVVATPRDFSCFFTLKSTMKPHFGLSALKKDGNE